MKWKTVTKIVALVVVCCTTVCGQEIHNTNKLESLSQNKVETNPYTQNDRQFDTYGQNNPQNPTSNPETYGSNTYDSSVSANCNMFNKKTHN